MIRKPGHSGFRFVQVSWPGAREPVRAVTASTGASAPAREGFGQRPWSNNTSTGIDFALSRSRSLRNVASMVPSAEFSAPTPA